MAATSHETGTLWSGDIDLFYRHFGKAGSTPLLIAHGANYYDSADWIGIADQLAAEREIVAWDTRGFGRSGWSASKDYSWDAEMSDILAVMDRFGWKKAVILGHSFGGAYAILFSALFPDRTAGLVIVDHCPIGPQGNPLPPVQSIHNKAKVYPSREAALPELSRDISVPQEARLAEFMTAADGGFVLRRDPNFANRVPVGGGPPKIVVEDMWKELGKVAAPTLLIRAKKSDRYPPPALERMKRDHSRVQIAEFDCGHDVVAGAPAELVGELKTFLRRVSV